MSQRLRVLEDLGEELERAIVAGAGRPARSRRSVRSSVVTISVAVASVAVVVLVGVVALGTRPRAGTRKPSAPLRHSAPGPVGHGYQVGAITRQELLDNFAVLRRPQTAEDRTWSPQCSCAGSAIQENGLTRLAQTLPGGYRIFFDVEQFTVGGQEGLRAGSYVLNLDIVGPNGNTSSSFFGANVQYMVNPLPAGGRIGLIHHRQKTTVLAGVVPDGVGSVTWTLGCAGHRFVRCAGSTPRTYTVPVINNVAALETTYSCGSCNTQRIVWRAPQTGKIVASFGGGSNLAAPPFVKGGRGPRTLRALLPAGIGSARFGQRSPSAITTIEQLLGSAAATNISAHGCGIDHESVWASPAVAIPLTIFQHDGRFVGYEYGSATDRLALRQGPGAVLATQRGLTLADEIGAAKTIYGPELATSPAHGGSWHLADSTIGGYLEPTTFPPRRVMPADPVATIQAGDTGCAPQSQP